jgi:hypothetical protein
MSLFQDMARHSLLTFDLAFEHRIRASNSSRVT